MEHYVTLFDSLFLPQGLALHLSMVRHAKSYKLWIICVDDQVYDSLSLLKLKDVNLLKLSVLETDELKKVKNERSRGEYCWTLTPFAPLFVFQADSTVNRVTYIDADMWFRDDPSPIFREFEDSGKFVMITEHAYAPEYDQSFTSGRFCVQFITFIRGGSELVRSWWERKCIEWCYARFEDGKFGDQKYLDIWPSLFQNEVHIMQQQHFMIAPWNATRFPYGSAIFFHFHGVRLGDKMYLGDAYKIPKVVIDNIFIPYAHDISSSLQLMKNNHIKFKSQYAGGVVASVRSYCKVVLRLFNGFYVLKSLNYNNCYGKRSN